MKKQITPLLLAAAALLASCGQAKKAEQTPADSVTIQNCQFDTDSLMVCYRDGQPYTGTVWTSDVKSARMSFSKGNMTALEYYHPSGALAVRIAVNGSDQKPTYFDPSGKEITEEAFAVLYTDSIVSAVNTHREELYKHINRDQSTASNDTLK